MTTDFRALCAELTKDLELLFAYGGIHPSQESHDLIERARAALAAEAEPEDWDTSEDWGALKYPRAALAEPVPEGPSDDELLELSFWENLGYRRPNGAVICPHRSTDDISEEVLSFARAVLARWGTPDLAQVRSSLGDEPQPVPEGPSDAELDALLQAIFAQRLHQGHIRTTLEVDFARAVLARWGVTNNKNE